MGAQSVTGKGRGSADGKNKGSQHQTLGAAHLVGPRVVAAGVGKVGSVTKLDLLPGVAADYIVLVVDTTGANAAKAVLSLTGTQLADATYVSTLTFTGTGTDAVAWTIIKTGVAI